MAVSKLKLLKQNYLSEIYKLEDLIVKYYPVQIKLQEEIIENVKEDIKVVEENTKIDKKEKFSPMILKDKVYYKKEDAGKMILEICKKKTDSKEELIGEYRGMKMYLEITLRRICFKVK